MRGKEGAPNLRSRANQNSARCFVGISIREISCLHAKTFLHDSAGVTAQNKECCIRRPCTAQQPHTNPTQKDFAWCGKSADLERRVGWFQQRRGGGRGGIPCQLPARPPPRQPFQPSPTPTFSERRRMAQFGSAALVAWAPSPWASP